MKGSTILWSLIALALLIHIGIKHGEQILNVITSVQFIVAYSILSSWITIANLHKGKMWTEYISPIGLLAHAVWILMIVISQVSWWADRVFVRLMQKLERI